MAKQIDLLLVLLLASLHGRNTVQAQTAGNGDLSARIDSIRLHVTSERSKLFSGKVSGGGWEKQKSPLPGEVYEEIETRLSFAFDDAQQAFFTQRSIPFRDVFAAAWVAAEYANVSTPETTIVYSQKSGMVMRLDPQTPAGTQGLGTGAAIDPRLIGSCSSARLFKGDRFTPQLLLNNLSTKGSAELLATEEDSIVELRLTSEHMQRSFFINQERGFTVVRMTRRSRYEDVDNNAWSPFQEEHEIDWQPVNDVWVPTKFYLVE